MAMKVQAIKFARINRNNLTMKDSSNRTCTGALKGRNRVKAHGKMHKHL